MKMTTEDNPPPEKKKRVNRKKKGITESSEDKSCKIVTAAIKIALEDYKTRREITQDNVEVLSTVIEEYLQNFLLIGYNYDGEMIAYTSAKSQLQSDSLNTGLYKYITQSAARGMPPVPPAGPPTGSPY